MWLESATSTIIEGCINGKVGRTLCSIGHVFLQKDTGSAMAKHSGAHLDLSAFSSPEELMSLGLDRLKSALMALGLKCGGYVLKCGGSLMT